MTPSEFKSWFDGFVEGMDSQPNENQWERIKARVAEIDGKPVTYPVYVNRYWPSGYYPSWQYLSATSGTSVTNTSHSQDAAKNWGAYANAQNAQNLCNSNSFDGTIAMYALGKADRDSLS